MKHFVQHSGMAAAVLCKIMLQKQYFQLLLKQNQAGVFMTSPPKQVPSRMLL